MNSIKFDEIVNSLEECIQLGKRLSQLLNLGDTLGLVGDLGAGKTTFVKGILLGLNYKYNVTSPTFTLINEYEADKKVVHMDFYRENNLSRWETIGFYDYINLHKNITIIEWSNLHKTLLPDDMIQINFEHISENKRRIFTTL